MYRVSISEHLNIIPNKVTPVKHFPVPFFNKISILNLRLKHQCHVGIGAAEFRFPFRLARKLPP